MNFNQQFIIASLLEETKNNGGNIDSLQSSKAMLSKTFYDIIYATSVNYSTFYE